MSAETHLVGGELAELRQTTHLLRLSSGGRLQVLPASNLALVADFKCSLLAKVNPTATASVKAAGVVQVVGCPCRSEVGNLGLGEPLEELEEEEEELKRLVSVLDAVRQSSCGTCEIYS